jgi:hypothetical protein
MHVLEICEDRAIVFSMDGGANHLVNGCGERSTENYD